MNGKNDILEELRLLSAFVATINRETPYQAPEGYFLSFPMVLLEKVQTDLPRVSKPLTFSVPEGYFDGFAQQVLNRIKTSSGSSADMDPVPARGGEDETLPAILAQAGRDTPYRVPEGYFEGLSPVLTVLKDKNPYIVPAGYFDRLAAEVIAGTAGKVIARTAAEPVSERTLGAAAERGSNGRLAGEDRGRSKGRVVAFGNWAKYAAAAVVAGLIVTVGWLRWHTDTPPVQLAVVKNSPVDIAKNLSKVSDAELQNFLVDQDTTLAQPITSNASTAAIDMDDNDIKSLLGEVPDGELKQYLEEQEGANDNATN
jgi:hypothetical protein